MSEPTDYLDTVKRLEPDVSPVDITGALTSIAISLKRIADALEPGLPSFETMHDLLRHVRDNLP